MSEGWLRALRETPELRERVALIGLVDLDAALARSRADANGFGAAIASDDLQAVLGAEKPDLVFDLVIPAARHQVVTTALAHGAHVLSEKPMANSLAEARSLIAAASAAGRLHGIIQNRRFLHGIRRVKAMIDGGALGNLTAVHADFFIGAHFGGFRDRMDHVLLLDMAIHTFDAARYLIGTTAQAVYCRESNPEGSWYAQGASADALFDFEDGVTMTYRGSWCAEGANTAWEASWRIIGTKGTLIWDGNDGIVAQTVAGDTGFLRELAPVEPPPADTLTEGHAGAILDFVTAVERGTRPMTDGCDNINSLAMVFAAIASAGSGRRVAVTPHEKVHHD